MLAKENPFVQLVSGVVWLLRNGEVYVNQSSAVECNETQESGGHCSWSMNVGKGRLHSGQPACWNVGWFLVLMRNQSNTLSKLGEIVYTCIKYSGCRILHFWLQNLSLLGAKYMSKVE